VFSYYDILTKMGAVLSVSIDNPTIGRQAASIAATILSGNRPNQKVQYPAGSHITINMRKVKEYGLTYSKEALSIVNHIIE